MMAVIIAVVAVGITFFLLKGSRKPERVAKESPTLRQTDAEVPSYSKGKHWSTDRSFVKEVQLAKTGLAAMPPRTIMEVFEQAVKKHGDKIAMRTERPCPQPKGKDVPPPLPLDEWKSWSFQQYYDECRVAARAFKAMGMEPLDGVNIFGFNAPEWFMGLVAAVFGGGIAAGIYPTDSPAQVIFKSKHSNAAIALCESREKAQVFLDAAKKGELPALCGVVVWGEEKVATEKIGKVTLCHWDGLAEIAEGFSDDKLQKVMDGIVPGTVCGYIYTSGTTGNPKAVMITHDNILFEGSTVLQLLEGAKIGASEEEERILSYLPLSHVAGMLLDIISPICVTANTKGWCSVSFARVYDLKLGSLVGRLTTVQPTIFLGVPRVWEKVAEKMMAKGANTKGLLKAIATFAKGKGLEHARNLEVGGSGEYPSFYGLAEKLVLSKVAKALGLNQLKFGLTGAAPIQTATLEYFGQLGININEVYGMSECCGATTWSTDEAHVWGSCGFVIPGVEVKAFTIDAKTGAKIECPPAKNINKATEAEQGELCYRGRHIMTGYMANPSLGSAHVKEISKKNEEAIDEEGWLHSGDKGCIDRRGFVKITGRYKELIITAGGENVAPVPIEDYVKKICPGVSNIMMLGDKQKFNIAIITLKSVGATGEKPGTNDLEGPALDMAPGVTTVSAAMKDENVIKAITKALVAANKNGECCPSNASKIQKFTILPRDFSVETGEFTPTLKLKRSWTMDQHPELIARIYASKETYVPFE